MDKEKKLFLPYIYVSSVEEYFNLPKREREKYGLYLLPFALPSSFLNKNSSGKLTWDDFYKKIKEIYPIQYFLREVVLDNINFYFRDIIHQLRNYYIFLFNPQHRDISKTIPRNWKDLCSIILDTNFAIIVSFYNEANESCVEWDYDESHRKFKTWLDDSYDYISVRRPILIDKMWDSYPEKILEYEKLIDDSDTKILKEMVEYRNLFWT